MLRFTELVASAEAEIESLLPWDLSEALAAGAAPLVIDIREPHEYAAMHIAGSLNVPRGVLEMACEYGYEETLPELAASRDAEVVLVCRSGNRTALAAQVLRRMGFTRTRSLRTGLRGWNDYEQPLIDHDGRELPIEDADAYFTARVRPEQLAPAD